MHPRQEPLVLQVKPLNAKTTDEVKFDKEKSVFKLWRNETKKKRQDGFEDDFKMWKCLKFIKDEYQVE